MRQDGLRSDCDLLFLFIVITKLRNSMAMCMRLYVTNILCRYSFVFEYVLLPLTTYYKILHTGPLTVKKLTPLLLLPIIIINKKNLLQL